MIELPSFTYKVVYHSLYSDAGSELRSNPNFNDKQFLSQIKKLIYSRYYDLCFPLIHTEDIHDIAASIITKNYLVSNEGVTKNSIFVDKNGQLLNHLSASLDV